MFDIAWCDECDLSVLCLLSFINGLVSREQLSHLLLLKRYICRLLCNHSNVLKSISAIAIKVINNKNIINNMINNRTFEHASLIFTEPWRWQIKIC